MSDAMLEVEGLKAWYGAAQILFEPSFHVGRQGVRTQRDGRPAPSWTPEKLFAIFPNLAEMPDRRGAHMSGGEQQMLTVARTLMAAPPRAA